MAVSYQLVIDCRSPEVLTRFWAAALHYVTAPPPAGFESWDDFYRSIGVPEAELGGGVDSIVDPNGEGPRIWFQIVPEEKSIKNRIHIDVDASGGRGFPLEVRRERVEAESARLVALGATRLRALTEEGLDHYGVAMTDPEGNEFDIN
ncbi:VOC family protein [Kribbella albertanoniae]|uniref:VOC family protein n=1 Tax=Kribbella albertanoniae TaxID=1266829 RepID=A0A4R4PKF5_9ACTN|nr:VOC family protein [Kribbella albertanoniae]TDC22600.1 VOC family protein [Kribbella albertanoniae]